MTLPRRGWPILGGCLLVGLVMLAEYGAFEILGFQTFTTEIYTEFLNGFNSPAACALSLVLVVLSLLAAHAARGCRAGGGGRSRTGALAARVPRPHRLGRATAPGAGRVLRPGRARARRAGRRDRVLDPARRGLHAAVGVDRRGRPAHGVLQRGGRRAWPPSPRCRWRSCPCAIPAGSRRSSSAATTSCWPCRGW